MTTTEPAAHGHAGTDTGTARSTPAPKRRETKQRTAILEELQQLTEFISAQGLHARLRENGYSTGLATVYRTLQALVEDGLADHLRTSDGESMYRCCSRGHHHHLTCRECRTSVEIDAVSVESWAQRTASAHGFCQIEHIVELFGLCQDCAAAT